MISAVYLFYVDIMKAEEFRSLRRKRDGAVCMSLSNSFRQLLGVSSLTLLGFYIVSFWPFEVMEWNPSEWIASGRNPVLPVCLEVLRV